ncbi:MAG: DUF1998 domain-containing protein [Micrococcales bacterium]|nr:DUF1998 domain-containing protein [Micrococcales bacterium]MCL2668709.1 DUF1998 domain-containing protein [Micrococcales bacterium]
MSDLLYDPSHPVDPLGDGEQLAKDTAKRNYAKVGSARPSSLLYTYGPGSIIDLPHFTIMPTGLDDWERILQRRDNPPTIHAPRLLEEVQLMMRCRQVAALRPFPHQATTSFSREGTDIGVPARVFPQWMRCTGCDRLAQIGAFLSGYRNTHPYRPDEAVFEHAECTGRRGGKKRRQPCVPARYLLACTDGHLDEFPYDWWVHRGDGCTAVHTPVLKMVERPAGKGATAVIVCESCGARRTMSEAQGTDGRNKLPQCRGRLAHLDAFLPDGCAQETRLMLVGASNLWFAAVLSIIDMPRLDAAEQAKDDAAHLRSKVAEEKLVKYRDDLDMLRDLMETAGCPDGLTDLDDTQLAAIVALALAPPESEAARNERQQHWDPVNLLVPEWRYLQRDPIDERHENMASGLTVSPRRVDEQMVAGVSRVLAVDRLRKVNALLGFTRIDDFDRINDVQTRLVRLTRDDRPTWVPATEDRGEGVFCQLDEDAVADWEQRVRESDLWEAHKAAQRRNFERRFSETAKQVDPETRLGPPRYWLVHTFAHALIRQMAMSSGYGSASLTERVYAWTAEGDRPPAAGVLIATTASDSDGTLGGLVALSEPQRLAGIVTDALRGLTRCSSDPVCARRVPKAPEDFLHGAACHCCVMASETSCERANRFLDRRFVVPLPGDWADLAFFDIAP